MFFSNAYYEKNKISEVHRLHQRRMAEMVKEGAKRLRTDVQPHGQAGEDNSSEVRLGEDNRDPKEWATSHTCDCKETGGVVSERDSDKMESEKEQKRDMA